MIKNLSYQENLIFPYMLVDKDVYFALLKTEQGSVSAFAKNISGTSRLSFMIKQRAKSYCY